MVAPPLEDGMLVLATFLAIGVFFVAFLLRFIFALHSEARVEKERDARTKRIPGHRIPIAVEVRKPRFELTVTYSNPGLVRRAGTTSLGAALAVSESSRTKKEA